MARKQRECIENLFRESCVGARFRWCEARVFASTARLLIALAHYRSELRDWSQSLDVYIEPRLVAAKQK